MRLWMNSWKFCTERSLSPWSRSSCCSGPSSGPPPSGTTHSGASTAASSAPTTPARTVLVHGAKVYIPLGAGADQSGAGGARRMAAITWINRLDTRVRFWVSGVVREE